VISATWRLESRETRRGTFNINTTMSSKIIIVGAGPAGLTAATELAETGHEVVVLEADPEYVGGISRTVRYKSLRFDIGGHRFFSKNPEIVRWWQKRLPHDFLSVRRQSRIFYRGRFFDYPLRPLDALRKLGVFTSGACVASYLWSRVFPIESEHTFADWVSNRFGKKLFTIFFKTYTEKVWGMGCDEISADWASQRIKGLSLREAIVGTFRKKSSGAVIKTLIEQFQYPRLGPGMMWEKTRDDLAMRGVPIYLGRRVVELHRRGERIEFVRTVDTSGRTEDWAADQFILTMPLRDCILGIRPGMSFEVEAAARELKYCDFITVALMVEAEKLFTDNWIYIHDSNVHVGRVQNFNNWSADMVPRPGVTCLGLEYFCNQGDTLWARSDIELIELAKAEMGRIGLARPDQVVDACVVRMEKAYPVYDREYRENVGKIRKGLSHLVNLQVAGRNGMHKYNNQDHSMMTGLIAARRIQGSCRDPWRVNTDAEYIEGEAAEDMVSESRVLKPGVSQPDQDACVR
jgi:protoporphyrinogen oxidase